MHEITEQQLTFPSHIFQVTTNILACRSGKQLSNCLSPSNSQLVSADGIVPPLRRLVVSSGPMDVELRESVEKSLAYETLLDEVPLKAAEWPGKVGLDFGGGLGGG